VASSWVLFFSYQDDARSNKHQITPKSFGTGSAIFRESTNIKDYNSTTPLQLLIALTLIIKILSYYNIKILQYIKLTNINSRCSEFAVTFKVKMVTNTDHEQCGFIFVNFMYSRILTFNVLKMTVRAINS